MIVSILVFLEYEFRPDEIGWYCQMTVKFQSLFSWNMNSGPRDAIDEDMSYQVSILVFLEYEFRLKQQLLSHFSVGSFNPCFPGIWIQAEHAGFFMLTATDCFNPCFPGIWIQALDGKNRQVAYWGFNPCFPGIWIQAIIAHCYGNQIFKFQSLFSWNMNSGPEHRLKALPQIFCFNPCFPGIWIQAIDNATRDLGNAGFNPCFPGIWIQAPHV